jgi:hypothetical protein
MYGTKIIMRAASFTVKKENIRLLMTQSNSNWWRYDEREREGGGGERCV